MSFYAVRVGKQTGVFDTWDKCSAQVNGVSGAQYKKFKTADEAWSFVNAGSSATTPRAVVAASVALNAATAGASGSVFSRKRKLPAEASRSYGTSGTADIPAKNVNTDPVDSGQATSRKACRPEVHLPSERTVMVADSSKDSDGYTVVYTDGACRGNGKKQCAAGIGVYWGPGHASNVSERLEGRQTNNHAEIKAACKAIQQAKEMEVQKLCIRTDSRFLIDCVTKWMPGWKKKGWTTSAGTAVANKEELLVLDDLLKLGVTIKWEHVEAHAGIVGNEVADSLACEGARKPLPCTATGTASTE